MAKTTRRELSDIINDEIQQLVTDFLKNPKEQKKMTSAIRTEMRKGAREGKGWDGKSFPPISQDWITRKAALIAAGTTKHKSYSHSKSNITLSGQLVRNLDAKYKSTRKGATKSRAVIEIFATDKLHKRYKTISGKRSKSKQSTHATIVEALSGRGWRILGIYGGAKKKIVNQFKRFLRRAS